MTTHNVCIINSYDQWSLLECHYSYYYTALLITHLLSSIGLGPSLSLTGLLPPPTDVVVVVGSLGTAAVAVDAELMPAVVLAEVEEDSDGLERISITRRFATELNMIEK